MSDNPFGEPEDDDRTIIRPVPGGRPRAAGTAPGAPAFAETAAIAAAPIAVAPRMLEGADGLALGSAPLAAAAVPLFALMTRLRNTVRAPDGDDLRERTAAEVRRFERSARDGGVPMELLRPAHYALCASLDDVVLNTPWGSTGAWPARSLVSTFHQEVRSGERFFDLLGKMNATPGTFLPVIELMYLCMSLGFIGRYRLSPRGLGDLEKVREDTYAIIARQRAAAHAELSPHAAGLDAPYRPGRVTVPVWVGAVAGLAAIGFAFAFVLHGLNDSSDALYGRMLAASPSHMPQISRAPRTPPPPPPPSLVPTDADRLRGFLAPEIREGLVSVVGTPAEPIIRISNRGLFASGRAAVQPSFDTLLQRIGAALRTEPGAVEVIGYTDDQPIRTVAFPSNYALSTARAKAAGAIIGAALGMPGRIGTEGRADADPVASNATAAGREQNRRIEVVLDRTRS